MGDFLVSILQPNLGNKLTAELANGLIQAIEKKHLELVAAAAEEPSSSGGGDVA